MPASEDCKAVNDWLREPDYAERFNAKDWTRWTNSRPVDAMARLTAALSDQVVVPRDVYVDLLKAVTDEVNEKGAGGYLLARLSDARKYTPPQPSEDNGPDTNGGET